MLLCDRRAFHCPKLKTPPDRCLRWTVPPRRCERVPRLTPDVLHQTLGPSAFPAEHIGGSREARKLQHYRQRKAAWSPSCRGTPRTPCWAAERGTKNDGHRVKTAANDVRSLSGVDLVS